MLKNLIVLIGLPASGKSTYCAKYQELNPDTIRLSSDDYIERYAEAHGITYNEAWPHCASEATKDLNLKADWAFKAGKNVIWDQTNLSSKKRRKVINSAGSGYTVTAVVFETPFETCLERNAMRPEGRRISDKIMHMMKESYQPVEADEGFDFIVTEK